MKTIACKFMGRFGNQMFQYAFCRGYAETHGFRLETEPWIGQKIFEIDDPAPSQDFPVMAEADIERGNGDVSFISYAQNQMCADFYSRSAIKNWFRLRSSWQNWRKDSFPVVGHYRAGDYFHAGYPIVSINAIRNAAYAIGIDPDAVVICREDNGESDFPAGIQFLNDFLKMMDAEVLIRTNSTFSWWAGALGDGTVYSPRIDGLECGREHDDVKFEFGNHCRTADLQFITDIHLKP